MRLMIAVLCLTSGLFAEQDVHPPEFSECLSYRLVYNGISGADAEICTGHINKTVHLHWSVITGPVFSFLFPVENEYDAYFENRTGQLIANHKNIKQRNIRQQLTIEYDFEKNLAITNEGAQWSILQNTTNLMGMLYDLRKRNPQPGDSLFYILDVETQLWQLVGTVFADTKSLQQQSIANRQIQFCFIPLDSIQPRPWKTDLFTNNIAGYRAELQIILGPNPQNKPFYIRFSNGKKRVEMYLKE